MKPKLTLITALALASVTGAASAQDAPPPRPKRTLPEHLQPYDTNKDGRLSREEYKAFVDDRRPDSPRSPWDTDGDGRLSEAEIEAARAAMREKLRERYEARFNEADADDNNSLSYAEFRAILPEHINEDRAKAVFDRLESDDEGEELSLEEFLHFNGLPLRPDVPRPPKPRPDTPKPKPPVPPTLPEELKPFDTNNDGILSRDEIRAAIEAGKWPFRPKPPAGDGDHDDDDGGTEPPPPPPPPTGGGDGGTEPPPAGGN